MSDRDEELQRKMHQRHGRTITNPSEALKIVGAENSELHQEMTKVWGEVDLYRNALFAIINLHKDKGATGKALYMRAKKLAEDAIAQKRIIPS